MFLLSEHRIVHHVPVLSSVAISLIMASFQRGQSRQEQTLQAVFRLLFASLSAIVAAVASSKLVQKMKSALLLLTLIYDADSP